MSLEFKIRQGKIDDLQELQQLFVGTVQEICKGDYDEDQRKVWASGIQNTERWLGILTKQYLLIALDKEKIVGFCSLDKGNYVDFLYVHKDYQAKGIASKLYSAIEQKARQLEQSELISDVSITAKPFFEKIGFKVLAKQTVSIRGVELTNFKMKKELRVSDN